MSDGVAADAGRERGREMLEENCSEFFSLLV